MADASIMIIFLFFKYSLNPWSLALDIIDLRRLENWVWFYLVGFLDKLIVFTLGSTVLFFLVDELFVQFSKLLFLMLKQFLLRWITLALERPGQIVLRNRSYDIKGLDNQAFY